MSEIKEYSYINLRPADNGFVLEYTEKTESKGKGDYDECKHHDRKVVFPDGEDGIDGALAKMKEMYMFNKVKKSGVTADATTPVIAKTMG